MCIVGFTAIFEAIDATAQHTPLSLAIIDEYFAIDVLYKITDCRLFFFCNILAPEKRSPCCALAPYSIHPVFDLTLNLPEKIFWVDIERAVNNSPGGDIHRFQDGMRLIATLIKDCVEIYAACDFAFTHFFLRNTFKDSQVEPNITAIGRINAILPA